MIRSILEITREMSEIFAHYELTQGEFSRTKELIDKLENNKITISVIGQFKRGKSYTVNSILGDKILPIGIVPVTAVVTTIEHGKKAATVRFENGIVKEIPFEEMSTYINEQENNDNHLGVSQVEIYCESDFLENGLTFVDTPGVGSVHQKNTDAAYSYVKESDGVIFMLSVDSPINQIEIEFLKNAKEYASKFYFAVNKIDTVDEEELEEYLDYCRNLLSKLMEVEKVEIFPISAKKQLGIDELKAKIQEDREHVVNRIIQESAKLKMKDIASHALSQISLYRKTLQMTNRQLDETFNQLSDFVLGIRHEAEIVSQQYKSNPRLLEASLNDFKNQISQRVRELYSIDYHYDISTVDFFRGGKIEEDGSRDLSENFLKAVDELIVELNDNMKKIFMYKEEDTYTVTKRIYEVNALTRHLMRLRRELERSKSEDTDESEDDGIVFKEVNCR